MNHRFNINELWQCSKTVVYQHTYRFYLDEYPEQEGLRLSWFHSYEYRHFWDDINIFGNNYLFIENRFNKVQ